MSDEPLAGAYLEYTRRFEGESVSPSLDHLESWNSVVDELLSAPPVDEWEGDLNPPVAWVQKHVANQLLLHTKRGWLGDFRHVFVLRDPRGQLAIGRRSAGPARLEDTCIPHQLAIYRWVLAHLKHPPIVLFEEDLLRSPQRVLTNLCDALGLPFDPAMIDPAPQRGEGDACWYPEQGPVELDEAELAQVAELHSDLVWRCHHMQTEMMAHCLASPACDAPLSWSLS